MDAGQAQHESSQQGSISDREQGPLNAFFTTLQQNLLTRDLRTGAWYSKVLGAYVAYYAHRPKRIDPSTILPEDKPALARKLTDRTALWSSVAGTTAATGVTVASVVLANTAFLAAPVVLPLAGLGLAGELFLRAVLHLQLTCELAELYGMPFLPGSESELIRVSALALRAEMHETEDDPGRGLVERISRTQQSGTLGKLIATGLVGESLLRNAIPFADVPLSCVRNWQLTQQVGHFVQGYASRRVALDRAVKELAEHSPASVEVLLQGIWFIFISDGRLTGIETALLSYLMRERKTSSELTAHFVSDEAAWIEQLQKVDTSHDTRTLFLRALEVAAAVELPVTGAEQTILQRVSDTLAVELAPQEVQERLNALQGSAPGGLGASSAGERQSQQARRPTPEPQAQPARPVTPGRERVNEWARSATFWASRTLHRLTARPHVVTVTMSSAA